MPSLEQVKQFRQEMFEESMALIDKKGADYNRKQQLEGDTLFNLRVCEILGIVPTAEQGILVRLSDKFMRLISLLTSAEGPAVKEESVRDTARDLHNYLDYALLIAEERRQDRMKGLREATQKLVEMVAKGKVSPPARLAGQDPAQDQPLPCFRDDDVSHA